MALWITGGHTVEREVDGVTLEIRVMSASDVLGFMKKAQALPDVANQDMVDGHIDLCFDGCAGWTGEGVPAYSKEALGLSPLPALVKIIQTIVTVNTVSGDEKGNSHAS